MLRARAVPTSAAPSARGASAAARAVFLQLIHRNGTLPALSAESKEFWQNLDRVSNELLKRHQQMSEECSLLSLTEKNFAVGAELHPLPAHSQQEHEKDKQRNIKVSTLKTVLITLQAYPLPYILTLSDGPMVYNHRSLLPNPKYLTS
ncbi:hypothetical protein Anapl_13577 [Anas platyrhynchos]|uniref:Uncharacterized protein n=1 Tax=Anas platyrhynchos TaxID=8839 RepID=R0LM53_ANAPL|nr:hypothetical protein Anapl_13577 [Anas platyrhynchos]